MPHVEFCKVRYDKETDSLVRYFQIYDGFDNSGVITVPIDSDEEIYHTLHVEAREPLRTVGNEEIAGVLVVSSRREVLIRRIQSDAMMRALIKGVQAGVGDPWPVNQDVDGRAPLHPEDEIWELSL